MMFVVGCGVGFIFAILLGIAGELWAKNHFIPFR